VSGPDPAHGRGRGRGRERAGAADRGAEQGTSFSRRSGRDRAARQAFRCRCSRSADEPSGGEDGHLAALDNMLGAAHSGAVLLDGRLAPNSKCKRREASTVIVLAGSSEWGG
jgi:hypothetical protein